MGGSAGGRRGRPLAPDPDLRWRHAAAGDGHREHAERALETLLDPEVFGGTPFGPTNVAQNQPSYDPRAYWRGAAWPQMSYLLWLAARRWDDPGIADQIARNTIAGEASGWAEYWNPQTGEGLGAAPQSWTALAAAMADPDVRVMAGELVPVLEVGGTHVTAALVTAGAWDLVPGSLRTSRLDADGRADELLDGLAGAANSLPGHRSDWVVASPDRSTIGKGSGCSVTSASSTPVRGRRWMRPDERITPSPSSRPVPERRRRLRGRRVRRRPARGHDRAVCITLGTGVGSAFLDRGPR